MTDPIEPFAVEANPSPVDPAARAAILADPGFGKSFTDHMVSIRYRAGQGWYDARVMPRGPVLLDPATSGLHYAQQIFEGMKAYRTPDGSAALFRPAANAARFRASAKRMAMAELPDALFLESVRALVRADRDWIPPAAGSALYLRPFMYASEVFLGVKPATEYHYLVIASPAGPYFKGGAPAISIWVSQDYSRAAPGGTGAAKCGGNYAASLIAQAESIAEGCDQVVFLDARECRYVEELGGMNLFFVFDDNRIVTPPLTGTILPGITRDSILTLAADMGLQVEERAYAIDEWQADAASGHLRETLACGTAAVVTPVGAVRGRDLDFRIGNGGPGDVTSALRDRLVAIQRGEAPDPHGWVERVD
ncbi:branched-chain amino acid aminotransferase [Sphingomonas japonica]|uniref:Branched-chain-amino-acid aminotransferase n=1 Tax=Sphingomonas japonica TaxID=511662 RepID=A0ABX0TZ28_9SPHN|nr:branched-chain amino acid aminotransferase [Sphingomonas japonica]NIJ23080.1 branched-chain amino acid aminotransferase [Sphingomonas japonica]